MTGEQLERGLRERLDNWKPWVGIAYFALVAIVIWSLFLNRDISRQAADRAAEQKSAQIAQISQCYQAVTNGPDVSGILAAVRLSTSNALLASRAALAAQPRGPLVNVRKATIERQELALAALDRFAARIKAATPTQHHCDKLAIKLGQEPRASTVPK